ncbi:Mu transposase C-terminal domain-containing protein [Glaciecola sp. 1036]|uniref:Mu transposase C-terminal domain-containing protein n=1 Tax=Alteromonadaceae TaxID=72275 RepID=UPI003D057E21
MGKTKRTVLLRAKKECWEFEETKGLGGVSKLFFESSLPADVLESLQDKSKTNSLITSLNKTSPIIKNIISKQDGVTSSKLLNLEALSGMDQSQLNRAIEKVELIDLANQYQIERNEPTQMAWKGFCDKFNSDKDLKSQFTHIKKIGFSTLCRWKQSFDKEGLVALVDNWGKKKGRTLIDSNPSLKNYCTSAITQFPHIKGPQLAKIIEAEFQDSIELPSEVSCRRWIKNYKKKNPALFTYISNPAGFKNSFMSAMGDLSSSVTRINQMWEFDSTPTDVMLTDGRYSIIAVIDVFTRRVKAVLWPTSAAMGIASLIRSSILDWGVPEVAVTDNGADYVSHHIASVWDALEVHNHRTNPHSPWEKPHIERFFRTFSHGVAELFEGYIGHNVSDREKINSRLDFASRLLKKREKGKDNEAIDIKLTAREFEQKMNQWIEFAYHHSTHSETKKTPFEIVAENQNSIRKIKSERQLDILLAPVPGDGIRTVTKEGVKVDGAYYIHAELGACIGDRVMCRWNPKDIGKITVFSTITNKFICEAVNPEIAGSEISYRHAVEAKKKQRAILQAKKNAINTISSKLEISNAAQKYLDYKQSQNSKLSSLESSIEEIEAIAFKDVGATQESKIQVDTTKISNLQEKLKQKRDQTQLQEAIENHEPTFNSVHAKATYYAKRECKGFLSPEEKAWLLNYRRDYPGQAAMLEKILEEPGIQFKKEIK